MPALSIAQQTGWVRPSPQAMLQGFAEAIGFMEKVKQWDFDLDDPGFQWYLKARGLADHIFRPESEIGRILRQYRSADEIMAAGEDMPRYLVVARARLQDAWEMYCEPGAHEIMELWGGYRDWKQPGAAKIDGLGTMAQQLLADLEEWGIKVERHGESVDVAGGNWPEGKRKEWKRRFNECWREFIALLPDCNSLMQAPEGFAEVSPGNFVHQDDLPTVRAMMALAGIEAEAKPTAPAHPAWQAPTFRVIPKWTLPAFEIRLNPKPIPKESAAKKAKPKPVQVDLFGFDDAPPKPKARPQVMAHTSIVMHDAVMFRCEKCGWESEWKARDMSLTEAKRGIPCEQCNREPPQ